MTYLKPPRVVRRRVPRNGLSGILDVIDVITGSTGTGAGNPCLDQANAAVAPFDAKIDDLVKNWQPTGFYTTDDIRTLVSQALATVQQGQAVINQAAAEPNASQDSVMRATDDLARAGSRSLDYLQAATEADQQGIRVVNAPGLKRWVTDTMAAASSAMVTASVIGCITPWWVGALAAFQRTFDKAWTVIKAVVGAVIAIGETVLKVANDLPDLYGVLKWVGLALGAVWVYENRKHLGESLGRLMP